MDVKLIALDLDGTTLNPQNQLTEKTKHALCGAIRAGAEIVPVTGRCYKSLPPQLLDLECGGEKAVRYVITSNGAEIRSARNAEVLYHDYISPSGVEEIKQFLQKKDLMVEVYVKGSAYMEHAYYKKIARNQIGYRDREYVLETRVPVRGVVNLLDVHNTRIEKVAVYFEQEVLRGRMEEELAMIKHAHVTSSGRKNIEFVAESCNKAKTLELLCGKLQIDMLDVMAAGDSRNDMEMLQSAGISVAMGNGEDCVKACADYIAGSNERDGLARAIEELIGISGKQ